MCVYERERERERERESVCLEVSRSVSQQVIHLVTLKYEPVNQSGRQAGKTHVTAEKKKS